MKIPVLRIDDVYHLGTLDIARRGANYGESYEGRCLSVSRCPEAWEEIARLGGSQLHEMHREGALFLDVHSLSKHFRKKISEWAIEAGHAEMADRWRYRTWDPEGEAWRHSDFATKEEADDERDEYDERPSLRRVRLLVLTESGAAAAGWRQGHEAFDHACILYAQEVLAPRMSDLMGLWWNDEHDPDTLSAPRGGILPERLEEYVDIDLEMSDVDDQELLEGMPETEWLDLDALNSSAAPRPVAP